MQLTKPIPAIEGQNILITGGTGSLGSALARHLLSNESGKPDNVIILSRDEAKQHWMREGFTDEPRLVFRIGDVRRYDDVAAAVRTANVVINAAALKQVPSCEYNPTQAILTNCIGPANIVQAVNQHGSQVHTVIGISTDKACEPVNAMGATKFLQERIFTAANLDTIGRRFLCVRYGNVMGSRGSVIPLFQKQVAGGGPVTVTNPEMTRFLMTLGHAVDTIVEALRNGTAGEVIVPIAPSASMFDIAAALTRGTKAEIAITATRPGEKIHETLISEAEVRRTIKRNGFLVIRPDLPEFGVILSNSVESALRSDKSTIPYGDVVEMFQQLGIIQAQSAHPPHAPA